MAMTMKFTFMYNLKNPRCSKDAKLEAPLREELLYFILLKKNYGFVHI